MLVVLLVVNIPVYLFLGWVVFDNRHSAAQSFFETLVGLLKLLLVPRIVRMFIGMDEDESLSLLQVAAFLFACGMVVYGEFYLLDKWFGPFQL